MLEARKGGRPATLCHSPAPVLPLAREPSVSKVAWAVCVPTHRNSLPPHPQLCWDEPQHLVAATVPSLCTLMLGSLALLVGCTMWEMLRPQLVCRGARSHCPRNLQQPQSWASASLCGSLCFVHPPSFSNTAAHHALHQHNCRHVHAQPLEHQRLPHRHPLALAPTQCCRVVAMPSRFVRLTGRIATCNTMLAPTWCRASAVA